MNLLQRTNDLIARFIHWLGTLGLAVLSIGIMVLTGSIIMRFVDVTELDKPSEIAALIGSSLLVGGVIFAGAEYIENDAERQRAAREQHRQEFILLVERLMNQEAIETRRWVFTNITPAPAQGDRQAWFDAMRARIFHDAEAEDPAIGRKHIKQVLSTLDPIGYILLNLSDLHRDEDLMHWLNPMVAKVWERLGPYIEMEAQRRNESIHYYEWARKLGDRTLRWRKEHGYPQYQQVDDAL